MAGPRGLPGWVLRRTNKNCIQGGGIDGYKSLIPDKEKPESSLKEENSGFE